MRSSLKFPFKCSLLLGAGLCLAVTAAVAQARTVATAHGEIDIDGRPERVVTLYEGALDAALVAGVTPLGAVATRGGKGVAAYLQSQAGDVAIVGTARETNIEAVAALGPDLILAAPSLSDEQYQLLSRLAPTIVPADTGFRPDAWKEQARLYARALDREAPVSAAIEAVEQRADALAEQQPAGETTATLARWMPHGPMIMSTRLFSTGLLAASGYAVRDGGAVREGRPHSDPLSLENLARIDSDRLFLATLNDDGDKALAAARRSPAFERLQVVDDGHVVAVDGQLWTSASGPLAAQRVLDDIEQALAQ
ncbi:iron complex transport system substrate-binding protein [Kushneria sinocarnis]|uniref:Iron complex transport system substrate-binding protein n=1 Tax=Kushneria sinocarnis TaxID=595502 RepID=A0A420WSQ4_9GAMM|nr:iron-siderophore ABC transporter substrate-binding protein [Kushneria sinocarnis]RKQ95762.1 iron complex transport system substrate-binding protein [Kushneria sinocarnis]